MAEEPDLQPPTTGAVKESCRKQLRNPYRGNQIRVLPNKPVPVPEDPDPTIPLECPIKVKSAIEEKLLAVLHLENYIFRFPYRYRYRERKIKKLSLTEWKIQTEILKIRSTNFVLWPQYDNTYWIDAEIHKSTRLRRMFSKLISIWKVDQISWSASANPNFDHVRFLVNRKTLHKWCDFADRHTIKFSKTKSHDSSGEFYSRFLEYLAYINMPLDFKERFPYLYTVIRDQWIANLLNVRNNRKIQKMLKELRHEFTFFAAGTVELYDLLVRIPNAQDYLKSHPEEMDKLNAIEAVMKPWIDPKYYPHKIIDVEMLFNEQKQTETER